MLGKAEIEALAARIYLAGQKKKVQCIFNMLVEAHTHCICNPS